jgi:hypothetical protein
LQSIRAKSVADTGLRQDVAGLLWILLDLLTQLLDVGRKY